jgi:hypothetical protein
MKMIKKILSCFLSVFLFVVTWTIIPTTAALAFQMPILRATTPSGQQNSQQIVIKLVIGSTTYTVNGQPLTMDAAPIISGGRTLLPLKYVATPLGASVDWSQVDQKVTVGLNGKKIELWIGQGSANVNGTTMPIDPNNPGVAPVIVPPGRTMLPLRFITESLGCQVAWDPTSQSATITYSGAGTTGSTSSTGSQTSVSNPPANKFILPSVNFITSPNFKGNLIISPGNGSAPGKYFTSKAQIPPDLLGDILGNSNQTPVVLKDVQTDKNQAGVSYLGHGYDVITGNYADAASVKDYSILDTDKLLQDGKILKMPLSQTGSHYAEGESAQSYSQQLATSVGLSGGYLYFSGSVKANFSSDSLTQSNSSFATLSYYTSFYDLYIDQQHTTLADYLDPAFAAAINDPNIDPDVIFDRYGTHVLLSERMGGRLDYSASANSSYTQQNNDMQADMDASFNAMFASANVSVSTSKSTASSSYTQNSSTTINAYPAYGSGSFDPTAFAAWFQSMQSNPALCDFGQDPLIPISQLLPQGSPRQKQIEAAYIAWGNSHDYVAAPHSYAITGIRLAQYTVGDAQAGNIPAQFVDPQTHDTWQQVANIAAHTMDPGNGLTVVYVRYGFADETPPVVGIFFTNENHGFSPDGVNSYFKQMYGNDPTAKVWGYGQDELSNSGQDNYITGSYGDKMRLYYVTGMSEQPLVRLRVRWINPDGSTDFSPAQQPTDPTFFPVIDASTYLINGQAPPQNCDADTEGADVVDSNYMPVPFVNHHYIEYAYQE